MALGKDIRGTALQGLVPETGFQRDPTAAGDYKLNYCGSRLSFHDVAAETLFWVPLRWSPIGLCETGYWAHLILAPEVARRPWQRSRGADVQSYSIVGLNVVSELEIPAANPGRRGRAGRTDVTIKWGTPPSSLPDARFQDRWIEVDDRAVIFRPKPGLTFQVRDGREITIGRTAEVSDSDVLLFLVGSVWGLLCHQRGLLPLHCSAIEFDGRAIAFAGPSGAGKSTLAAGLSKRGHPHLCDDVCILDASGDEVRLLPMPKGLKLWGDATRALDMTPGAAVSSDERLDKYFVPVPEYGGSDELPLSKFYVLSEEDGPAPAITRLRGSDRFQAIRANLYRDDWLSLLREPADVFRQVTQLAQSLSVFRFSRPRDMSGFDRGLEVLEAHMCEAALPERSRKFSAVMAT